MRRPLPRLTPSSATRVAVSIQLACVAVSLGLLLELRDQLAAGPLAALAALAILGAGAAVWSWSALSRVGQNATTLSERMDQERAINSRLETQMLARSTELEDAQRVLQRMWWLGQQITLELNPQRVLERFLEAVTDIAQGEGGIVGLVGDDGKIHVVVATGVAASSTGLALSITSSAMGRVIRTGTPWTVSDVGDHLDEVDETFHRQVGDGIKALAVVPISRRGERIGAVTVATREEREFTPADLERIEAMGDLLSVSLENAELVETLRQTEWRFRTLFRAAPDAVLTVLQSGRIREANDAVRDVTGLDPLQVVGRPVADLVVDADRDKLSAALDDTFEGRPSRVEVSFRTEDHSRGAPVRRVVALAMRRLPEADPPSVLVVGRDMTSEREMSVRLMESDRLAAVGELVAGVAHEVNNPLSSISAFAQLLLRDESLTASQRDSIDVIKSETFRASQVVKDLLAFARRSDPHRERLELNDVVQRTLRLRGYQLTSHRIAVETDLFTELPAVIGDARQLQQVCLNLMTNAIQAMVTAGAGGTLSIATRHEGADVVLEIRDTGPGISDRIRAHIFEPFFTTKPEGEGTGLGLSVSYGIVTAHGGRIEVAATSAAGTTFRVTLPAAEDPSSSAKSGDWRPLPLRSPLSGLRMLLVTSDSALRSTIEGFGASRGFAVLTAPGGAPGLEIARAESIDVVICDLQMAGMDGTSFHEQLRRERPGLAARTVFLAGSTLPSIGRHTPIRQPVLGSPLALDRLEQTIVTLIRGGLPAISAGWP